MSTSHDALSTGLWVRVDAEQLVSLLPAVETVNKGGWCRAVGCCRWVTGFLDRTGVGVGSVAVRLGRWGQGRGRLCVSVRKGNSGGDRVKARRGTFSRVDVRRRSWREKSDQDTRAVTPQWLKDQDHHGCLRKG